MVKNFPCHPNTTQIEYKKIRNECAIITCCSSKYAPYLANAIASLKCNFADHPVIIIYDIGLSWFEVKEFSSIKDVELRKVPNFVSHWRLNWSWKLYALINSLNRYNLYLDLPNFVVNRSLATLFCIISKHGYLLVENKQKLNEITPSEYWKFYNIGNITVKNQPTFGAGIIGFDRRHDSFFAIEKSMNDIVLGLNLGRSVTEKNKNYKPNIIRDCVCFRADQTILNLSFRQLYGIHLKIRKSARICGFGQRSNHPYQFLWYSRRSND